MLNTTVTTNPTMPAPASSVSRANGLPPHLVSGSPSLIDRIADLSPREREVLHHLATGASNKAIGRALAISDATVKVHVQSIARCTGISSRVQLAVALARIDLDGVPVRPTKLGRRSPVPFDTAALPDEADRLAALEMLSTTQCEIAVLAAAGLTNPDIAAATELSEGTIKGHLRTILKRLRLVNRTQLIGFFPPPVDRGVEPGVPLTECESYAVGRVAAGQCNKQIGREMGVTEATVKVHLRSAFKKLGVRNRTAAARWFVARELAGSAPKA